MNNELKVDGLVTGKIRDPQVFLQVMSMMIRLRERGVFRRVILSAWHDDLAAQATAVAALTQAGVLIVDNGADLPVRSCGNYWEQVKTLQGGLERIEDGVLMFKTRTDMLFYGGDDTVANIVGQNQGFACHAFGIKHRIWIPSFVALQPFFMADQCFMGLAEDFRRFMRFDADIEAQGTEVALYPGSLTHPAAASAEIRFWLQPFLEQFEVLRSYRKVWPLSMNGHPQYPVLQAFQLGAPVFQEYLAVYWSILYEAFRVSEGKFCIVNSIDAQGKVIVRANAHSNNSVEFIADALDLKTPYPVSFSSDIGLKRLIEVGTDSFRLSMYEPAYQRVREFSYTPERIRLFDNYLKQLTAIAYPNHS
ncbi:MAG: hypothetical protein PHH58_07530 [Rhodoferax sp.]|nr:hypothetical protein [Rhodoferax sp.]